MRITVSTPGQKPINITEFKRLSFFERLSSKWFGKAQKIILMTPQNGIQSIEIKEVKEKSEYPNANQSNAI